jgi:hypothetical protein
MKIRVSSSHIMISSLLSSWSYNLINLALIDRFFFIDRFSQFSWKSRYSRNLRIKLFSNRERFAKPYSTYSISSALTYATTLAAKTFRALMIISTAFDLKIWQYDAVSAFINNELMKNCTMSARTNILDSITAESWIKLYTN